MFTGRNEVVAKVMFLQVSVCPQGGRVSASVHAGMPDLPTPRDQADTPRDHADPPGPGRPPPDQADPSPPDQAEPPRTRQTPPDQAEPPPEADSSIRSTSGRYAPYWNAFLSNLESSRYLGSPRLQSLHPSPSTFPTDTYMVKPTSERNNIWCFR